MVHQYKSIQFSIKNKQFVPIQLIAEDKEIMVESDYLGG